MQSTRTAIASCILAALTCAPAGAAVVTGSTGGDQPHSNIQPSLTVNYIVALTGVFPQQGTQTITSQFIGEMTMFAGNFAPRGWAFASGQTLAIAQNQALYNLLGTTYGGNGVTTFQLPNMQDRVPIAAGQGAALTNRPLGSVTGASTTVMTPAQMPSHQHDWISGSTPETTGFTGGGQAMPVMQPSLAVNYFVDETGFAPASGGYPVRGQIRMTAATFVPGGTLADGTTLAVSANPDLAAVLGSTYGGNGTTTTAVPDIRGRTPIGAGAGNFLTNRALGATVGAESVTLTEAQLPVHTHTLPGGGNTEPEGGGQAYDNMQPSIALHYVIAVNGYFPSQNKSTPGAIDQQFLGQISVFAGDTAPAGWMFCDGQELSSTDPDNLALYSLLGTTYGGDGVATFDLPDLRGRAAMDQGSFNLLGEVQGVETEALTINQMAAHTHDVPEPAGAVLIFAAALASRRRR